MYTYDGVLSLKQVHLCVSSARIHTRARMYKSLCMSGYVCDCVFCMSVLRVCVCVSECVSNKKSTLGSHVVYKYTRVFIRNNKSLHNYVNIKLCVFTANFKVTKNTYLGI